MSIILDALNRSKSERDSTDAVPGLHTDHGAPAPTRQADWKKLAWPAAVVVLAILAALPWLFDDGPSPTPAPAVEPNASSMTQTAPTAAQTQRPVGIATGSTTAAAPGQGREASVPTGLRLPDRPEQGAAVEVSEDIAALYANHDAGAPAAGAPAAPDTEPEAEPALDVDALALAAQQELEAFSRNSSVEPVVHTAPYISDLRQSLKDQIPTIYYNAHNWASNPAQRTVVLNGEERRAGEQLKPGLRLEEILEDSIVLSFQGTEFRLRSMNSWVNL